MFRFARFNTDSVKNRLIIKLGLVFMVCLGITLGSFNFYLYSKVNKQLQTSMERMVDSLFVSISINGFGHRTERVISYLSSSYNTKEVFVLNDDGNIITSNKALLSSGKLETVDPDMNNFVKKGNKFKINLGNKTFKFFQDYSLSNNKEFRKIYVVVNKDIKNEVSDFVNQLVISFLIIFFVFILLVFLVYRSISKDILAPIQYITDYCVAWGQGFISRPLEYERNDEIKIIYDSLSMMIGNIEAQKKSLEYATKKALELNKAKSSFLANMSHEIRTPLNSIIGFSEILKDEKDIPDPVIRMINDINSSGRILLAIVNDILDLSKIEAGKLELEEIDFSLKEITRNVYQILAPTAENKGLELKIHENFEESICIGDPTRITQILINLTSNAIKFTDKGNVTIDVYVKDEGGYFDISMYVSDTGIGISKEAQLRLFDRFEQAHKSDTRLYGGTGLGLSISKLLANLMEGDIEVDSKLGEGSTFRVQLQLLKSKLKVLPTAQKVTTEFDVSILKGCSILLAEDNLVNQRVFIKLLQKFGIEMDVANDGVEAVKMAENKVYDYIFMDIQMPNLNGVDATFQIRNILNQNHPIIIGFSANAYQEDQDRAIKAGMNFYMSKPITLQKLANLVGELKKAA